MGKRAHYNRLEPFLKEMKNAFMNIKIDYQKAQKWILDNAEEDKKFLYYTSLYNIQDKIFRYFHRNKTNNRLDTNLTNLKSEFRPYIIGDYVNIDLKNSQPFLLSQLINKIVNNDEGTLCGLLEEDILIKRFGKRALQNISILLQIRNNADLVNLNLFTESCINGSLYDDFTDLYSETIERDDVKNIMFTVMFSENENSKGFIPYEKDKKKFASVYLFVYTVIKFLKSLNHKNLAIFLQRLESYIFIDCIAKKLVEDGIVPLTIHDSFIVKKEDEIKATAIIEGVFLKEFGVIPTFKSEPLKPKKLDENENTSTLKQTA